MRFSCLALALLLVACDAGDGADAGTDTDSGMDSGMAAVDGGMVDAGPEEDAGGMDSGMADAGMADSGMADAGMPDAGMADAGMPDAGMPDAGMPDAGRPDAGRPDAGAPDAGPPTGPCMSNADCPPSPTGRLNFCQKAIGNCGGTGTCMPRPMLCPLIFDPHCGCDLMTTHSNVCIANSMGMNVAFMGPCP